jgi:quinol monooxygenase YgiN
VYGLIVHLNVHDGQRDEMIDVLCGSAANMPGYICDVVANDASDDHSVWVTEVWDSEESHTASLSLPAVRNALPLGKQLVASFDRVAVTAPVWIASHASIPELWPPRSRHS